MPRRRVSGIGDDSDMLLGCATSLPREWDQAGVMHGPDRPRFGLELGPDPRALGVHRAPRPKDIRDNGNRSV